MPFSSLFCSNTRSGDSSAGVVKVSAVILAVATLCSAFPLSRTSWAQQRQGGTIRVQSDLVNIPASVIDPSGQPIPDLTQDAFQLSEEGVPQKIVLFEAQTNRPLDLALMIDASMSTLKDMKFESEAAARFIREVTHPGDMLALFEFSESVTELSEFSGDVHQLESDVHHVFPGSGTSIYDAVVLASNALKRRGPGRRRAIILVTDGGETTSVSKFDDARRAAIASSTLLYSIIVRPVLNEGLRNTAGEHALITITNSAGGALFIVDSITELDAMFDRINRELRTQYLLGYYPNPTPPPGSDRHVEVKVKNGDLVRYRQEYFTSGVPN
jgi:Ca-activated chloride channel family protein